MEGLGVTPGHKAVEVQIVAVDIVADRLPVVQLLAAVLNALGVTPQTSSVGPVPQLAGTAAERVTTPVVVLGAGLVGVEAWLNLNVVVLGTDVRVNVPLNTASVAPERVTLSPAL